MKGSTVMLAAWLGLVAGFAIAMCIIPTSHETTKKIALELGFGRYNSKTGAYIQDSLEVRGDTIFIKRNP